MVYKKAESQIPCLGPLIQEISVCCRFGQSHTVENEQACRRSVAVSGMLSQLQSEDEYLRAY